MFNIGDKVVFKDKLLYPEMVLEIMDVREPWVAISFDRESKQYVNASFFEKALQIDLPPKQISINVFSVQAAAEFEIKNNHYSKNRSLQEVLDQLHDYISDLYEDLMCGKKPWEFTYVSTCLFTVVFFPEEDYHGVIEVLVDPSGNANYYADCKDYLSQC